MQAGPTSKAFPCDVTLFSDQTGSKEVCVFKVLRPAGTSDSTYDCMMITISRDPVKGGRKTADEVAYEPLRYHADFDYLSGSGGCSLYAGVHNSSAGRMFLKTADSLARQLGVVDATLTDASHLRCVKNKSSVSLRTYYFFKTGLPWYTQQAGFVPKNQKAEMLEISSEIKQILADIQSPPPKDAFRVQLDAVIQLLIECSDELPAERTEEEQIQDTVNGVHLKSIEDFLTRLWAQFPKDAARVMVLPLSIIKRPRTDDLTLDTLYIALKKHTKEGSPKAKDLSILSSRMQQLPPDASVSEFLIPTNENACASFDTLYDALRACSETICETA